MSRPSSLLFPARLYDAALPRLRPAVFCLLSILAAGLWALGTGQAGAAEPAVAPATAAADGQQQLNQLVERGLGFLAKSQAADGSYSFKQAGMGVTTLVATAVLRSGRTPDDPLVARSLKFLEGFVQPDGGVYTPKSEYRNYETCLAVMCFTEANRDKRYDKLIRGGERYIEKTQWTEEQGKDRSDPWYGGAGYGKHKRPDLSNTSFLVDALNACGNGPDDPAVKKALVFVSRCQNLESEHNTLPFATKNSDGGFYYTGANDGESQGGKTADGGLRSYASMTYAGLKSMIYAGVKADDPRVKAAVKWAAAHYDLKTNPGMGGDGLYYYYNVFAKALSAMDTKTLKDTQGVEHDWRRELVEELARRQRANGSWINEQSRWLEGDPNLVTGYALLALSYCR